MGSGAEGLVEENAFRKLDRAISITILIKYGKEFYIYDMQNL